MTNWNKWNGSWEAPVADGVTVEVTLRDGTLIKAIAGAIAWQHDEDKDGDVVAWRVVNAEKRTIDNINPAHYKNGKVECIDAIEAATTGLEGIEAVCTANIIRYIWRWKLKNGLEDLKKTRWYLDRLISRLEEKS